MRLTKQLLRSKTTEKLSTVHHLDLSNLDLVSIEQLACCPKLRSLTLHGNSLQSVTNLDSCRQLWNLDVSNNKLGCLGGLSRFVALGSLVLANNDLTWHELAKIRHIHILELTLSGNSRLQKEPYYRLHIIDSLPHVWMLDGKMITSAERLQVKHFFQDSALTNHPIRHKLPRHRFTPTSLKNISVTGIYGEKATHLLRRFPTEGSINVETDRLRVMYMAYNLQQDLTQQKEIRRISSLFRYHPSFLEDILADRPEKLEQCNMLLLLLVASLEFSLPTKLMKETLITSKLDKIGGVHTMDLFLLPRELRCHILTILMNMAKVDKDKGQNGGLYNALYHCLGYTVSELNKLRYTKQTEPVTLSSTLKNYKTLLASEIVQLLCVVPGFFQYLDKDQGVIDLLTSATNDPGITGEVLKLAKTSKGQGSTINEIYDEVADYIVRKVDEQLNNIVNKKPKLSAEDQILDHVRALPIKKPTAVSLAEYHAVGQQAPKHDSRLVLCSRDNTDKSIFPHLGDRLILGPQTVAKVVSLPQPFLALVLMDTVPDVNGAMVTNVKKAEIHYTYVNMNEFRWDYIHAIWQPKGTVGDRITIQRVEDRGAELEEAGLTPSQSGRPNSPVTSVTSPCRTPRGSSHDRTNFRKNKSAGAQRPMSAVLKEKLKLNLDMSKRPKTAMMLPAHHTLDVRGESMSVVSRGNNSDRPVTALPLSPNEKPSQDAKPEVLLTEKAEESKKAEKADDNVVESEDTADKHIKEIRIVTPAEMETIEGSAKETENEGADNLLNELADVVSISSELSNGEEPELKNLAESVVTEEDLEVASPLPTAGTVSPQEEEVAPQLSTHSVNKANSSTSQQLAISVPRVELNESLNTSKDDSVTCTKDETKEDTTDEPKPPKLPLKPIIKKQSERSRSCLETRPITAVEAYRFVVQRPLKAYRPPYASTRQKSAPSQRRSQISQRSGAKTPTSDPQRAWQEKEFEEEIISPGRTVSGRCVVSSSVTERSPSRGFRITPTGTWLGGGRDIHAEMMKKRPKSSHTPGWKEGLPKKPRRRSTAVGTQTSAIWDGLPTWTPTYLSNYNSLLGDGSPRDSLQLPDLPSLSDYLTSQPVRESQTTS